jgi:hypothetical protein
MTELNEDLTPMRVLFNILVRYGYVDSHAKFAELLRINKGNVAAYLAERDASTRIVPRIDTLQCWAWGVSGETQLNIQILLVARNLYWYVTGYTAEGFEVATGDKWPTTHHLDFAPLKAWRN